MTTWDERFREGEYPRDPEPSPVLRAVLDRFPAGRALDIATGTGRNAVFLAERGYEVDGIDQSREGLEITRERAAERGVDDRLSLTQGDAKEYDYPESTYDVVTISFFRTLDRLNDIKEALTPGGVLFYQHHLRSPEATVGPSGDRYRFRANELLNACLDLTVLYYEASTEYPEAGEGAGAGTDVDAERDGGRVSATATIVARNSHGGAQSYPESHWVG
ncbi:SAM-dependent methyltransferase [Salinigranum rubrum]|uniref:SAM-dependent methyltransferase n=1 Tax=Salinigranum rubrum TaxID=755307 RepID=A0A2I8VLE0_9EURY|nr:class I SAM-dependent methyltransferase [Salinigranum rubrum]AUV82728.1 SAM-dependent methyltransferase [Salinigranum rubrum]